ncbi:response regulator [Halobacillus litoralis]|uniref:response regulator n=1 Tax=Halobacillus litoralis TaxID=45668 RepID=UPI001CD2AF53|nr:response regulator [Halobacillus litoralis]MCA0971383.1 response regulator [Halobacillus litoralis]
MPQDIKVLIIEDDPMVQEVNRQFVERVPHFRVVDVASDGKEGIRLIKEHAPDLIILDVFMPNKDGLKTLKEIRSQTLDTDVIVITAANEKETIRAMFQYGIIDYMIKPFKFERLQQSLLHYRSFRSQIQGTGELQQQQIDGLVASPSEDVVTELPKGLNQQTLDQVVLYLQKQETSLSAEQVADSLGMARVTARRYLDYLRKSGQVEIDIQYGGIGRPVNKYMMKH